MIRACPKSAFIMLATAFASGPALPSAAGAFAPQSAGVRPMCIPWILCHPLDPATLQVSAGDGGQQIQVKSFAWGDVAGRALTRASSDPEEGGEFTAERKAKGKTRPTISEINVTKQTDASSPKIMSVAPGPSPREPGKLEIPNMVVNGDPAPSGTVTILVARKACATGTHFPEVKLTTRSRTFTLGDVDVTSCTAVGDDSDSCTLSYRSVSG